MQGERLMERVREIVSTIFDVPLPQITPESSPETVERWDSLGRLVLTVELEQEFGVQVSPEEGERLTSIRAIVALLETQSVGATHTELSWGA